MPTNLALLAWNQTDRDLLAAIVDALDNVIPPDSLKAHEPNVVVFRLRGNGNNDFSLIAEVMHNVRRQTADFHFVLLGTNPTFFVRG